MSDNDNLKMETGSRTLTFNSHNLDKVLDHYGREWRPAISADSLEEAAEKAWKKDFEEANVDYDAGQHTGYLYGFKTGAQHADPIAVDRTVGEILSLMEHHKKISFDCAEEETDELIKNIQYSVGLELQTLINQITKLKKP